MNMMLGFLLTGLFMTATVGGFVSVIILANKKETPRHPYLFCLVIALIIGFLCSAGLTADHVRQESWWNNGKCENDGTKWRLVSVEKGKYYYTCDTCGEIIWIEK